MLRHAVPTGMMTPETQAMLQWFEAYYASFPEAKEIAPDTLAQFVRLRAQSQPPETVALTLHLVDQLKHKPNDSDLHGITSELCQLDLSGKAGALIAKYNDGGEIDLAHELLMLTAATRRAMSEGQGAQWENRRIAELLADEADEGGLQWVTFKLLQDGLKGLRTGDNVAICAPTDKGKTSLLCRIGIDMQAQAKHLYPGRPTLYLVNEGTAARITVRAYQTAVGMQRDQMIALGGEELERRYAEVVGGLDMFRIVNIHGKNMAQVASIIERHNPHLVISDMTGRIRATSNRTGGANDIAQLEEVWNDFRELAVIHDFAHMGTVQVSAEGFDQLHPPLSALQNSKTGIQTTLDLALIMGALNNPSMQALRGLSTPKNKLARSGKNSLNMFQAVFEPTTNIWTCGEASAS